MTKKELIKQCKIWNIKGYSKLRKNEILKLINNFKLEENNNELYDDKNIFAYPAILDIIFDYAKSPNLSMEEYRIEKFKMERENFHKRNNEIIRLLKLFNYDSEIINLFETEMNVDDVFWHQRLSQIILKQIHIRHYERDLNDNFYRDFNIYRHNHTCDKTLGSCKCELTKLLKEKAEFDMYSKNRIQITKYQSIFVKKWITAYKIPIKISGQSTRDIVEKLKTIEEGNFSML